MAESLAVHQSVDGEGDAFAAERVPWRKVLLVASACVLYLSVFTRVLWRVGDEGAIVYGAHRVAQGEVPYRDFFEVYGPGSFYWLGGWFRIFGESWLALRLHLVLTGAAVSVLIYCLTLRVYRGRFEALPCGLFTVAGIPLWPASSHHWDATLFALAAVATFVQWQLTGRSKWLSLTGVLAAITTCVIQQKGAALLIAAGILLIAYRRRAGVSQLMRRILQLLTAYAAVLILVGLFFLRAGALGTLLHTTIVWPVMQYQAVNRLPYALNTVAMPLGRLAQVLISVPHWLALLIAVISLLPFAVIPLLPVVALLAILNSLRNNSHNTRFASSMLPAYVVLGGALFVSELQRPDIYHLLWGSPLLFVAVFGLATRLLTEKGQALILWPFAVGVLVFGAIDAIAALGAHEIVFTRRGAVRVMAPDPALQFVLDHVSAGSTLFVYPYYPMYYYLADVRNPTRYSFLMYHYNTSAQFDDAIDGIARERVEYVLWDTVVSGENLREWFPTYTHPPDDQLLLEHYLMEHYDLIETANGFRILRRRSS